MMIKKFFEFNLSDDILNSLSEMGFEEPSQIQKIALPPVLKGKDIIGVAQTGTGKTAAFGIPIIEKGLKGKSRRPAALVLVPTRELAMQVAEELNKIGKFSGTVAVPIYGGQSIDRQFRSLNRGIDIVVGTPGRVIDHIRRKTLNLSETETVVLDEADEMLNMGFIEDMQTILQETSETRQTLLFSATMPDQIVRISKKYMKDPKKVRVETKNLVVSKIKQVFYEVRESDKIKALTRILDVQDSALTLVFCHTKREVDGLSGKLKSMGYEAGAIHGDFTQSFRDEMMRKFKSGDIDILVATDVAARGLDINDVTHVINYSIPQNPDAYVHRIGRTGRAGRCGIAITFVTPREYRQLRVIERSARTKIEKGRLPTKAEVREAREKVIAGDVEDMIKSGKHREFLPLVETLMDEYDPMEVAAAALRFSAGELEVENISAPNAPRERDGGVGRGTTRLFLTIGKKDKIQVGDMVRTISEKTGIPGRNIGKISLFDKFSFVEVPSNVAELVISSINEMMVGGRKVKVSPARKRKGS
ncbi:MAG: DEAD/DEAH box helicase [Thermodesulfobacteriota bacterium]